MLRLPGRSATLSVLSISFRAFLLRISTFTLELLSIFTYGFFDFFSALTFDFIDSTRFSSWFAIGESLLIKIETRDLDFLYQSRICLFFLLCCSGFLVVPPVLLQAPFLEFLFTWRSYLDLDFLIITICHSLSSFDLIWAML